MEQNLWQSQEWNCLSPITEPNRIHILDEIFAEINVELNLVSSAKDTSYLNSDSDEDFE